MFALVIWFLHLNDNLSHILYYSDQEFQRFLDKNFPRWNSEMITPGFEFDQKALRNVDGPLLPEAKNPSEEDLQRAGEIEKFSLQNWTSSAYAQKG